VVVDTREKYGWKFGGRSITMERRALPAGDYAAVLGDAAVAVIERKTLENLATSLSDGGLAFQMQRLAEVARAAIVVEGDYPDLVDPPTAAASRTRALVECDCRSAFG